ncbi:hypothetical protein [Actinokineospora sp. NBRC 105648]|uniref:hypothetical protein n=1 Tax=Actinokineospora sp. NBRC 105648 TaxID=3032206 RepID=UPI0024A28BBC|nr:hypothetical protein [Actinokineospora sp. NBRC 105648]GLZ42373.1 hypothetical protein Acsp05_59970 [Actinokineospora sp. NBRC 105648]
MSPHRRIPVTSPQTRLAHSRRRHRTAWRPPSLDPTEARQALAVYRAQRTRAVVSLAALATLLFGLPIVFQLFPALDETRVLAIPLSWVAIVAVPFPAMLLIAWHHLRAAESAEDPE